MAKKKWMLLPGGRIKRWKQSKIERWGSVPPHWFRNHLNRKERQKVRTALYRKDVHRFPYIHQHSAGWLYW